jgi:hypothetical protein
MQEEIISSDVEVWPGLASSKCTMATWKLE